MGNFDTLTSLAIVLFAAVIHGTFQLSVSVLTLLSGHALGHKTAHHRLLRLVGSFILGAGVMTIMLLCTFALAINSVLPTSTPMIMWALSCGAVMGVGVSVWLFYYRDKQGTSLWVPRGFAQFLADRSKASKSTAESFGLGLTSIFAEILFVFAPTLIASLVLIRLPAGLQLPGVLIYGGISILPLLAVGLMIGRGHTLSRVQRWRESNKAFLQFAAGASLLVLGGFVYVEQVVTSSVSALGGGQ